MKTPLPTLALLGVTALAVALLAASCGFAGHEATAAPAPDSTSAAMAHGSHGEYAPQGDAHAGHESGAAGEDGDHCPKTAEEAAQRQPSEGGAVVNPPPRADGGIALTGTREETEQLIRHYRAIRLTPDQERTKVAALATIPAPCCDDNPLATCCCPCNLAKAAWGLAAWLITDEGYGVEGVRQATLEWLQAANPDGFAGNACYTPGGCARPIHQDGCGGMDERRVM